MVVLAALAVALNAWAFPVLSVAVLLGAALVLIAGVVLSRGYQGGTRLVLASVAAAAVFNFLLVWNFYPQLLQYQAGTMLGKEVSRLGLNAESVYYLEDQGRAGSFDFTTQRLTPTLSLSALQSIDKPVVLYTSEAGKSAVEAAGLRTEVVASNPDFRVTRLNARFLDPAKRQQTLAQVYLIKVGE